MYEYYGNNDYRDYLIHYGIPGMKWGKRKAPEDEMIDVPAPGGNSEKSQQEIDDMALEVIRGRYGNGEDRMKALGADYAQIQARVNEMMKSGLYTAGGSVAGAKRAVRRPARLKTSVKKDGTPRANESAESKANREKNIQEDQIRGMKRTIEILRRQQKRR